MKQLLQTYWPPVLNYLRWVVATSCRVAYKSIILRKNVRGVTRWPTHTGRFGNLAGGLLLVGLVLGTLPTVQAQTCTTIDYLYLNDPGIGATHKFKLAPTLATPTEIYSSGTNQWLPPGKGGISWSPHGLGQDLNGNIYIGQNASGPIAKFKPDGTLVNASFIPGDGGFNFVSKDGYLYVNTNLETAGKNNRITRYALCDGSEQGYITLNGVSSGAYLYNNGNLTDWGLQVTSDGTFYANAGVSVPIGTSRRSYIYRFKPTEADWTTNHPAITGKDLGTGPLVTGMSTSAMIWGITSDNSGNMYMVVQDPNSFNTGKYHSWVLKYDNLYNLTDSYNEIYDNDGVGIQGARGIIYYAPYDRLLIAGGKDGDCIAKMNPNDMTYTGALLGNEPGQEPKTLRIATEACPTASFTVDSTICGAKVGDRIFLQNIIGACKSPISGTWSTNSATGITFNLCDLSFTVNNLSTACGKFTLTNTGGTCGSFTITVNVDFADVTAPVIAGNQNVCSGLAPAPFTVTTAAKTTGTKPIKYQWQRSIGSCTTGFANVTGATSSTYAAPIDTKTRYYRVITTVDGSCTTPNGSCADTSNCVTLTYVVPSFAITANPGSCTTATNMYVLTGNITIANPISNSMVATLTDGTVSSTLTIPGGATSVPYTLTGLTANGALHNIKVSTGCGLNQVGYTAPAACACNLAISTTSLPDGQVGAAYNQTISTTGGTTPLTFAVATGSLPGGLSLNTGTGAITGTPSGVGTATFSVKVTDNKSCSAVVSLTIKTGSSPVCSLNLTTQPTACVASTNTYTVDCTIDLVNNSAGGTITITNGSSVTTVQVAANASQVTFTLYGLPSDGAQHTVTATLTNCGSSSDIYTAPASCSSASCNLVITTGSLPDGTVGTPYSQQIQVTGGTAPLTYAVATGSLPAGLSLDTGTGAITGTPSGVGTATFSIKVTDSNACSDEVPLTIKTSTAPVCSLNLTTQPTACVASTNTYTVDCTIDLVNNSAGGTITITNGSSVTTVQVAANASQVTFTLYGLPSDGAQHTVTATLTNCGSSSDIYTAPVSCACNLVITTGSLPDGTVGTPYSQQIQVTGGTAPLTYAVATGSLPAGLSLDTGTGAITGTPSGGGTATFSIKVTDSNACSDEVPLTIKTLACSFVATATPGTCSTATNTYMVDCTVDLTNNALGGTITVTNGSSVTTVQAAANASQVAFTLYGLPSDGAQHTLTFSLPGCGTNALVTYTAPLSCTVPCSLSVAVTATSACDPITNKYTVTGTITLAHSVNGVAVISDGFVRTTVLISKGDTFVPFTLPGVTSDGQLHTLSVMMVDCGTSQTTYRAPASCLCSLAITAAAGPCTPKTNLYTVTGVISLTNALAGVAIITDGVVTTTVTVAQGATSVPYILTGLQSDGVPHTIRVTMTNCGANTATYTAPNYCLCPSGNCFPTAVSKN